MKTLKISINRTAEYIVIFKKIRNAFFLVRYILNKSENATPVLHTVQINFQAADVNKYRYIQTPIGLLIFEVIGHVYAVQCEELTLQ